MTYYYLKSATVNDIDFIYDLRMKTMKPFFESTFGWKDKEQYKYAADYLEQTNIICNARNNIGVVKVLENSNYIELHQIQILPEYQKLGIGSRIIESIIHRANETMLPIKLMVMKNNPAITIYEKMGFVVAQSFQYNQAMIRNPD
jgi:ribosomal protein S18 acetylase RimI-like enzyme